jgi:hypothetical protein
MAGTAVSFFEAGNQFFFFCIVNAIVTYLFANGNYPDHIVHLPLVNEFLLLTDPFQALHFI